MTATTRQNISVPRGAPTGPEGRPIYGTRTVVADCLAGLAVHKALDAGGAKWTVTHEASGMKIGPLCAGTKARALENMRAAVALEFDWTRNEAETLAALRNARGLVDAVRKIGGQA
jgi:hypothetical protein